MFIRSVPKILLRLIAGAVLLCTIVTSFVACDNVDPENLKGPDEGSIVTYTISDNEYITLLFSDENFGICGEWYKNGSIRRISAMGIPEYWGLGASRHGMTDYYIEIMEFEEIELYADTNINNDFISEPRIHFSSTNTIAYFDAGFLNSKKITLVATEEKLTVKATKVSKATFEKWDWIDIEGWSEFCAYDENTEFTIDTLNITYTPYRNIGEWKTAKGSIPIKIAFYDDIKAFAVYDISNNKSKLIFVANVELNSNNEAVFTSWWGNLLNDKLTFDDADTIILRKESH